MVRRNLVQLSVGVWLAGLFAGGCITKQQYLGKIMEMETSEQKARAFEARWLYAEKEKSRLMAQKQTIAQELKTRDSEHKQTQAQATVDWDHWGIVGVQADGVLKLAGDLTFLSGRHTLTVNGKSQLRKVANALIESGASMVRVEGHTDGVPLKAAKHRYEDNLHLSVMRAHAVAGYLAQQGVPREIISITGYGPFQPISDKKVDNRRVEIRAMAGETQQVAAVK